MKRGKKEDQKEKRESNSELYNVGRYKLGGYGDLAVQMLRTREANSKLIGDKAKLEKKL